MRTAPRVILMTVVAALAAASLPLASAPLPDGQDPQVVSPLGSTFRSRPDTDGAIAKADAALAADPGNLDLLVAAARARDVALQFSGSIPLYTKAIAAAPGDVRAYRFRGHRYISTRRFDLALVDLRKAASLAPSSFDVFYHLGLALFLTGQFADAAKAYRTCLDTKAPAGSLPEGWRDCSTVAKDDDARVGVTDWLYRSLGRAGRADEARQLLAGVTEGMAVKENDAYYRALLFYKGLRTEAQVIDAAAFKENAGVTIGYGVANFYLVQGKVDQACTLFRRLVQDEAHWNAFGFIGAETELARKDAGRPCAAR